MSEKDVGQEFLFLMDIDERKQTALICSDTSILGAVCFLFIYIFPKTYAFYLIFL